MNQIINGQIQKDWRWLIAIYLFLGGVGGGAYTIAALNSFLGEAMAPATAVGLWISFPALIIGSLCLLADLGSPSRAILAGARPGSSWISRGFWIISAFMVLAFLHTVLLFFTSVGTSAPGLINLIAILGIACAVGTMAYTGLLLAASKGVMLWRSGVIPVVFVISALVTGHFSIMIGMAFFADTALALRTMAAEAAVLVVVEVLAILFFLQAAYRQPDPRASAEKLLANKLFLVGYFVGGLAAPFVLMLLVYAGMEGESAVVEFSILGALLGLIGGLILRQGVLEFGALPTLNLSGFEFRRVARPKEPKPAIGLMPPS